MSRQFRKEDIEFHGRTPAVNVKVSGYIRNVKLPLELGSSAPMLDDGTRGAFTTSYTDAGFTHYWINENVDEEMLTSVWEMACSDGFEMLQEAAQEIFGAHVHVYSEGRSGGWAIVDGIDDDVDSWDAIAVNRWARFVKVARAIADDIPHAMVMSLYMNEYEREQEEIAAQGRRVADLIVMGGH